MKEILIHLIDQFFDNLEGCIVAVLVIGLFVIVPILLVIANMIK
jgi:hypothetical protein